MNIKKTTTKFMSLILSLAMVFGGALPAYATEASGGSILTADAGSSEKMTETYKEASNFFVTIPKTIVLDGSKQANYSVKVSGNIDAGQCVYIAPIDGVIGTENIDFYMKDQASKNIKDDVLASVIQNKMHWNSTEVAAGYEQADNLVSALGLTAGTWKGIFQMEIKLESHVTHTHNYIETITKEATCTEDGEKKYTCECGDNYMEVIPAGHHYENGECTDCGEKDPSHTHSYTETITKEPTCIEEGEKTYTCNCGGSYTEVIPATGHHYVDGECEYCGGKDPDAHTHNYIETITKEAACTEDGEKKYTCECGDSYTEVIPAGHHYGDDDKCTECGEFNPNHEHNYTENAKIFLLENTSNGTYAFVQDGTKWTSNNKGIKSSTATSTWTITVTEDTEYSFKYKVSSESNWDKLTIKLDDTTVANAISGAGEEITYTGTLTAGTHTLTASYVKDSSGNKNDDCGYVILKDISESNHKCTICGNKEAHDYVEQIEAATCIEDGSKTIICSFCGKVDTTIVIPATGHHYVDGECTECGDKYSDHSYIGTITKAATCTENGIKTYTCTICGGSYIEIILANHDYEITETGANKIDTNNIWEESTVGGNTANWSQGTDGTWSNTINRGSSIKYSQSASKTWIINVEEDCIAPVMIKMSNSGTGSSYHTIDVQLDGVSQAYLAGSRNKTIYLNLTKGEHTLAVRQEIINNTYAYKASPFYAYVTLGMPYIEGNICKDGGYTAYKCRNCGETYKKQFDVQEHNFKTEIAPIPVYEWMQTSTNATDNWVYNIVDNRWESNNSGTGDAVSTWEVYVPEETTYVIDFSSYSSRTSDSVLSLVLDSKTIVSGFKNTSSSSSGNVDGSYTVTLSPGIHTLSAKFYRHVADETHGHCGRITLNPICVDLEADVCANCGYKKLKDHYYLPENIEPTCTERGYIRHTCIEEDDSYNTDYVDALGHDFKNCVCTRCGAMNMEVAPASEISSWNYTLNNANKTVTLNYYTGNATNVTVYGAYEVNGQSYRTKLQSNLSNTSTNYMFKGNKTVQSIVFNEGIDTSTTTGMIDMFYDCSSLVSLDLGYLDTSNTTDMLRMFCNCTSLVDLNVSGFNTGNVTNMQAMFSKCSSLTSLDLGSFETGKVKNMRSMFNTCSNLKTIYVTKDKWVIISGCDTVVMFTNCGTSSVTYK